MTPSEIKKMRHYLKLSAKELASLLDTDEQTVRRMEQSEAARTFRKPAPRMLRLIKSYQEGYRPKDWPKNGKEDRDE